MQNHEIEDKSAMHLHCLDIVFLPTSLFQCSLSADF